MIKKTLITTSIAYVNASPHLGFAMESIEADAMARWRRQRGHDVYLLTGTDEHGSKNLRTAKEQGVTVEEFVEGNSKRFRELDTALNISVNDFIRTTEPRHQLGAQEIWKRIAANGDLVRGEFKGLYCVGCENFLTEKELIDGKCPIHLVIPETLTETNIFFKLSRYSDRIAEIIESGVIAILPDFRKNEILQLAKDGLKDISFSRPKSILPWGIPVPDEPDQVMYVWCDALSNYLTAVGFGKNDDWRQYWENGEVMHFIGKDILRFHAAIWPAMLLSAGLPLPEKICVHGFLSSEGHKMSKSLGNVVDPFAVLTEFNGDPDPLRFFLLSEIPFGRDADFSRKRFFELYNARLANGLGNLFSRVMTLAEKTGAVRPENIGQPQLAEYMNKIAATVDVFMESCEIHSAIEAVFAAVEYLNLQIDREKPWLTIKTDPDMAKQAVADWLFALEILARELTPFLPGTALKMQINLNAGTTTILFPRIDTPAPLN